VRLEIEGLAAQKRVYAYRAESFIELIEDMTANWKGWPGKKSASNIEGDFELKCTSDSLGHAFVEVHLRSDYPEWSAKGGLQIESGQFESIARDLRRFLTETIPK
jgi:hypothetical protein